MKFPPLPVATGRLVLRWFEPRDLDAVMACLSLADAQRYLDWRGRDRGECGAALEAMIRHRRFNRPGDVVTMAVARQSDDKVVGQLSLRWADATASQAEIRLVIHPRHRRKGYATEVARAALDICFCNLGFHRVFARCGAKSAAPAQLLRGLGMRLEAHYREHALFQGEWDEELHFAVLDREWRRDPKVKELRRHLVA